jgi:hypothetical protein
VKKAKRDLIVTAKGIFLVGRELEKSGPNKGQEIEVVTRCQCYNFFSIATDDKAK